MCILVNIISIILFFTIRHTSTTSRRIAHNGKRITIKVGNIFSQDGIIIIPVNRCFDTIVDDQLISSTSIHGQFINKYFSNNLKSLNNIIETALSDNNDYKISPKKTGNNKIYSPGTIVQVCIDTSNYYLLSLTKFDNNNCATCSIDDYCLAFEKMLTHIDSFGQNRPVSMPVIGSGLSRVDSNLMNLINLMITLIKMHKGHLPDISIIIAENYIDDIDFGNIN